ncbi:MAG TPA: response regulator transcription factor [Nitrospira sp.]|jgi:DNA-binding NarL/FixJ family response regulator|nr:response regulator transcription factor [Nitrospira sp.]
MTYPAAPSMIRVLLVDDHTMVREGIRSVLESYPDIEVAGEASDGEEAFQMVGVLCPSVVVMDINMPRLNGIEATVKIKKIYPNVAIVGLSVEADEAYRKAMTAAGARCLISKSMAVEELYLAIRASIPPLPLAA